MSKNHMNFSNINQTEGVRAAEEPDCFSHRRKAINSSSWSLNFNWSANSPK